MFGLARNRRLEAMICDVAAEAETRFKETAAAARVFKELDYRTRKSWSRSRRVVAKAEHLEKGANPRFIVTSLSTEKIDGKELLHDLQKSGIAVQAGSLLGLAEEAPCAYKDVDQVVEVVHAAGLATKVARLKPCAVIKG